jgi:serine/threonine protein phosphatase PrpC
MMHLSIAHCTELGSRENNQDFIGFCANEHIGCFALADGAGGYEGGAEASRAVVNEVLRCFQAAPAARCADAAWPIEVARGALASARERHPGQRERNTTVAALLIDTEMERASWCQLGDSRIYLFRNGRAHKLSHDHSVLQAMIDAGFVRGNLRGRQDRNTLYAAVGSPDTPPTAVCDVPLQILPGDAFLLCSDGFWDALHETAMEEALRSAATPEEWMERMLACIERPRESDMDNFSALAIWVGARIELTRILNLQEKDVGRVAWEG